MRASLLLVFAGTILAFPAAVTDKLDAHAIDAPAGCPFAAFALKQKRQTSATVAFDPVTQRVDVSGEHAFVPPRAGDQRGPCPGLNALANHGYLPRNGVTSVTQAIDACHKVYGMGGDLGGFLSFYAAIFDGDPLGMTWSIGGPAGNPVPPPLSAPQGLSGSHNKYEGDSSGTRADEYINNGDSTSLNLKDFEELCRLKPDSPDSNFDYQTLTKHHAAQRQKSLSTNPHYFNGPFSGILVVPGAYAFIPRMMSNHSAKNPNGHLSPDILKSFFAVRGKCGSLIYQKGYERIPENWYKRSTDYTIPNVNLDIVAVAKQHPEFLSIGGNTGTVNCFTGVDLGNLTGGVYNAQNLLKGNNLFCFAVQAAQQARPDVLKGLNSSLSAVHEQWNVNIAPILKSLGCPELSKYDSTVFGRYPGSGGVVS